IIFVGCSNDKTNHKTEAQENKPKIMKIGTGITNNHFLFKAIEKFKENVEEKTNGEIEVELYHSGQMGDDIELLNSIQAGTAHGTMVSPSKLANFVPSMELLGLPFLFDSYEQAHKVVDGQIGQKLLKDLEPSGFKGLGYFDFGFRHVTNNKHPINEVDD